MVRRQQDTGPQTHTDNKKPDRPRGPIGLMWYGVLTILGGIALVVVAD